VLDVDGSGGSGSISGGSDDVEDCSCDEVVSGTDSGVVGSVMWLS